MKISFNQFGQNLVLIVDKKKYSLKIENKEIRDTKVREGKELLDKFGKTKSDNVKKRVANKLIKLVENKDKNKEEIKKKGDKKKLKKDHKTLSKDIGKIKRDRKKYLDSKTFVVKDNTDVAIKGFEEVLLPDMLVEEFIGRIKKKISIQPLLNFWYKCLLNPNEVARTKLFDYLQRHKLIITPYGNFVTYRMVKDVNISGNKLPEGIYTDARTYSMRYRIGEIARLDRKTECDEDGNRDCSRGLHTGSPSFIGIELGDGYNKGRTTGTGTGYDAPKSFNDYFGNVAVICLVDPQHVVSIPNSDTRKMRSCELYFAKVTTPEEVESHLKSEDYNLFDSDYNAVQESELKKLLIDVKLKDYLDGKQLTSKRLENMKKKLEGLKLNQDVIHKGLTPIQIKTIIENRIIRI